MIQPLRRCHRLAFSMLGVTLPVLFVAGLMARRHLAHIESATDRINLILPNGTEMIVDARELWKSAVEDPDLLVYWTEHQPGLESLPLDARLVGSLESGRHGLLRVPRGARDRGYLILYSLAHQRGVAKARVPKEMP